MPVNLPPVPTSVKHAPPRNGNAPRPRGRVPLSSVCYIVPYPQNTTNHGSRSMQIESIEAFLLDIPLRAPLRHPGGQWDHLQTVLVAMRSQGLTGWGEASPGNAPTIGEEYAAGVLQSLRDWLVPALVKTAVDTGDELQERLAAFRGNRYAKAALDLAWWDLRARQEGKPLHQMLQGVQPSVAVGPNFDQMETIEQFFEAISRAEKAGFSRVGLKFRPGWDVQMLNFFRHEFPTIDAHIDCEGGLRLDHMEMLCRLDDFTLSMIEQPLPPDDLVGHAMVQEAIRTPICLDEAINNLAQADMALELHSCRFVKIEPGRVGGLTPAMQIDASCRTSNIPCWAGIPVQTAVGQRHALALAARQNFTYPADYVQPEEGLVDDVAPAAQPQIDPTDQIQRVPLWPELGIGVAPDLAQIEKFCVARFQL